MENIYEIWKGFFNMLPELKAKIEPLAKRSGLNIDTALYLILLFDFSDEGLNIPQNLKEQLINKGLAEYNNERIVLTGKGSILAKSVIMNIGK